MTSIYDQLTPAQVAIVEPVSNELQERFFDVVGRLNEPDYLGEFKVEAYKAALFLNKDNKVPLFLTYKYIRQQYLRVSDLDVSEEYNVIHNAVKLGIALLEDSLKTKQG